MFKRDRVKETTTAQQQTDYRKSVEKMLKDGDLYRIDYVSCGEAIAAAQHQLTFKQDQEQRQIRFYLTKKDDPTFDDCLSAADKEHIWRYYIASYTSLTPTEGIDFTKLNRPILNRNIRATGMNPNSITYPPSPADGDDAANERIQRRFDNVRDEGWVEIFSEREGGRDTIEEVASTHDNRNDEAKGQFERNNNAMKDTTQEVVEKANEEFRSLIAEGTTDGDVDSMDVE
jgi:paired amphipathic helix protein Sin3a